MVRVIVFSLVWVVCSVLAFGIIYAHFQHDCPQFAWPDRRKDAGLAMFLSMGGPITLAIAFLLSGFAETGLLYRPMNREKSWQEFHRRYPNLERTEWERTSSAS